MASSLTWKIDRFPEFLALLEELASRLPLEAAQRVSEGSARRAPVRTGALRDSHHAEQTGAHEATVFVDADYALYVHDGTVHQAAQPFLVPEMEDEEARYVDSWRALQEAGV